MSLIYIYNLGFNDLLFEESIFLRALVSGLLKDLLLISYDCLCRDYFCI